MHNAEPRDIDTYRGNVVFPAPVVCLFEQGHFLRLMVLLLGAMWAYAPVLDIYIYPRAGVYRYTFMII